MEVLMVFTMLLTLFLSFLLSLFFHFRRKNYSKRLPPGSLGLPFIGQSFDLLKALKSDKIEEWFHERIAKHGPVWKVNVLGYPTVVLNGLAANKFVYSNSDGITLANTHPPSMSRILGFKNIVELTGDDYKRVKASMVSFLKIDMLKQYVAKVDDEIQHHLQMYWHGKNEVKVQPLMKTLTFDVICSLLFGIERGPKREQLLPLFEVMLLSVLAIPINFPFSKLNRGLKARMKLVNIVEELLRQKRESVQDETNPQKDLITSFLNSHDDDNGTRMSDEEIIDNIVLVMVAGYDTTSTFLTLFIRLLANNESIYSDILREHEEISKSKSPGEALTWEDLAKMTYTWRVASEVLRLNALGVLTFRRAARDIEYEGYVIPKGWQVMLSSTVTHMDDSIFQNPTVFDPARFDKTIHPPPPPFSLVGFGGGARMCPGMEFAKMETLVLIHRLVTQFKWELFNKEEAFKRIPLPEFDQGLFVQIKPLK
uniref:taxadiene 5-alpha hydroxylase-like n=1 Tax=Erigeron canadensis TaxID=72917 RepID=UPI001CB92564|nr:taxadiene 5-alpha hydroxylase-like [Erigeron canadensis]